MNSDTYQEWISIFDDEFKTVWQQERPELRKITMIYYAFQVELDKLKSHLNEEVLTIKSELKKKDFAEKRKKFTGLAQSERFDMDLINKENQTPFLVPLHQEVEVKSEEFFIESPSTHLFIKESTPTPQPNTQFTLSSPVLHKSSFNNFKRKKSASPNEMKLKTPKIEEPTTSNFTTPNNLDDSNIMECSIVEDTPEVKVPKNKSKTSRLQLKRSKKPKLNKSKQATTLTQLFFEPQKINRKFDSDLPSMTVTEMINLINHSSSETDAESDETVDDLQVPSPLQKQTTNVACAPGSAERSNKEKEKQKLKGWSCDECKDYYEGLNLPPDELQKKMNQCSKHKNNFKPREDTYDGFWDLTFGSTPKTEEPSMVFNFKKK